MKLRGGVGLLPIQVFMLPGKWTYCGTREKTREKDAGGVEVFKT